MGIKFAEFQGRRVLWQGVQIHLKKIYGEFTVDIMEFVFVLAISFFKMLFIHFLEVMQIVGTFRIHTLMDDEMLTVFFMSQSLTAVWAAQGVLFGKTVVIRRKGGVADFALDLPGFTIVAIEVRLWGVAGRAFTVFWDVTLLTPGNRFNLLLIFVLKVRDEELPVPLILVKSDTWEFIGLEFLIFWGVGIIKSPLLERDIFADKIN